MNIEIKNIIYNHFPKLNYLGINLTKHMQNLDDANYIILMTKIFKNLKNWISLDASG
jgi:hypothetical protein